MAWVLPCTAALLLALVVRSGRMPGPVGVAAAASIPFLTPSAPQWFRLVVSALAVVWAARVWDRSRARAPDLEGWRFWLWWMIPADARLPRSHAEVTTHRRAGLARLARVIPKGAVIVAIVLVNRAVDDITSSSVVFAAWSMVYLYAFISAIADATTGLLMLTGLHMSESFERPMFARSPSEFWGRRWNRFVTRWAFRNVFIPMGGRRAPARATLLVFTISGLMHEYLIVACSDGFGSYTGRTLAFFLLHGLAVIVSTRVRLRIPRVPAIALHLGFLLATAPLFVVPLDEAVGFSRWWKEPSRAAPCTVTHPTALRLAASVPRFAATTEAWTGRFERNDDATA